MAIFGERWLRGIQVWQNWPLLVGLMIMAPGRREREGRWLAKGALLLNKTNSLSQSPETGGLGKVPSGWDRRAASGRAGGERGLRLTAFPGRDVSLAGGRNTLPPGPIPPFARRPQGPGAINTLAVSKYPLQLVKTSLHFGTHSKSELRTCLLQPAISSSRLPTSGLSILSLRCLFFFLFPLLH